MQLVTDRHATQPLEPCAPRGVVVAEKLAITDIAADHGQAAVPGLVHERPFGDAAAAAEVASPARSAQRWNHWRDTAVGQGGELLRQSAVAIYAVVAISARRKDSFRYTRAKMVADELKPAPAHPAERLDASEAAELLGRHRTRVYGV